MRKQVIQIAFVVLFAFAVVGLIEWLSACNPHPLPEPAFIETVTDAGDYPSPPDFAVNEHPDDSPAALSSPCGMACANLRTVPCREGFPNKQGVSCYRGCLSMAKHQQVPTACWSTKKTPEAIRGCGGIQCIPVKE